MQTPSLDTSLSRSLSCYRGTLVFSLWYSILFVSLFRESHPGLELNIQCRAAPNLQYPSCFSLLSTGFISMGHHSWPVIRFLLNSSAWSQSHGDPGDTSVLGNL